MILLKAVTKHFGRRLAVDHLDLEVRQGEVFGLLGHNGAGKSTTIGMLLGQVFPDEGLVSINGMDVFSDRQRALSRVGAIFETPSFYDYLSGITNLRIFCEYTGYPDRKKLMEIVELVGLKTRICERVATYSHGMRQRLALAQALLPDPEVLILDEPTDGLDPEGIHEIRNLILKLNREWGLTIFLSSHLLNEIQRLCSHLAVMHEGKLLFDGEWQHLDLKDKRIQMRVDRQADAETGLVRDGLMLDFDWDGRGRLVPDQTVANVTEWLVQHGYRVEAIGYVERTLEDFYLETIHRRASSEKSATTPSN